MELLRENGIGVSQEALREAIDGFEKSTVDFEAAYQGLGAEDFPQREMAQSEFLKGGSFGLEWLDGHEPSGDPEVRRRVTEIRRSLAFPLAESREGALRYALASLLAELSGRGEDGEGMLYEWFGDKCDKLDDGYRKFQYESDSGRGAKVTAGILVMAGAQGNEGDQRLVMAAGEWPKKKRFGDAFRVSAKMGGKAGGEGGWHLGIAIGQVRALYHPGFKGGGFRFEQIDNPRYLTMNKDMGFTPVADSMQWMEVRVQRLNDGRVELVATVDEGPTGDGRFEQSLTVDAKVIGDLSRVSLDRSGRVGGDAMFDDFTLDLRGE